jgi:hypothetical protein
MNHTFFLSVHPLDTIPKLFSLGSLKNNVVEDNEYETQLNRDTASSFYVDQTVTSRFQEPALGTDSYQEFCTLKKSRKYFQSILSADNDNALQIPKVEKFLLEVQKAFSEIYLLAELTTSVKNSSRFALINSFVKEDADTLIVTPCQKIYQIISRFCKSQTVLASGSLDFQQNIYYKRILVYYLIHHLSYQSFSRFSAFSIGKFKIDLLLASDTEKASFGRRYESFRDYPAFNCSFTSKFDPFDTSLVPIRFNVKPFQCSKPSKTVRFSLLVQRPFSETDGTKSLYEIASASLWKFLKDKSETTPANVFPLFLSSFGNMEEFCNRKQHESLCMLFFSSLKKECVENSHLISTRDLDVTLADNDVRESARELFMQDCFCLTAIHIRSDGIFLRLSESFFLQIHFSFSETESEEDEYFSNTNSSSTFFSSLIRVLFVQSLRNLLPHFTSTGVVALNESLKLNDSLKIQVVRNFQDFDLVKHNKRSLIPGQSLRNLFVILRIQSLKLRLRKALRLFMLFLQQISCFRDRFELKLCSSSTAFDSFDFELRTSLFPFHLLLSYDTSCFTLLEIIPNHPLLSVSDNESHSIRDIKMIDNEAQLECMLKKTIFGEFARYCISFSMITFEIVLGRNSRLC